MPIPDDAERVSVDGVPHVRFKRKRRGKMRTITAPLTQDGARVRVESPRWYGRVNGKLVRLFTDAAASMSKLAELTRKSERSKTDLHDPYDQHRLTPIAEHMADWKKSLSRSAGNTHVNHFFGNVSKIIAACEFKRISDIDASKVEAYLVELQKERPTPSIDQNKEEYTRKELARLLDMRADALTPFMRQHRLTGTGKGNGKRRRYPKETAQRLVELRRPGLSIKTVNDYLAAMKSFCEWLKTNRRLPDSPLVHLAGGNVKLDRRHDRRILDEGQLRQVFQAARESQRIFRGLTGPAREVLYGTACVTGLRASELAVLCPRNFDLDAPKVTLSAVYTKNGKAVDQPIPSDLAESLRVFFVGKPDDAPLWPGTWTESASDMIRIELDACGIPYSIDGADGILFADFHALRHSFIALLDRSGATLKEAMQLARHSDPKLTTAVYGRARLHDLSRAVDRLSIIAPEKTPQPVAPVTVVDSLPFSCRADDSQGRLLTTGDDGEGKSTPVSSDSQPVDMTTVDDGSGHEITGEESSPTRTRTLNLAVNSRSVPNQTASDLLSSHASGNTLALSLPPLADTDLLRATVAAHMGGDIE